MPVKTTVFSHLRQLNPIYSPFHSQEFFTCSICSCVNVTIEIQMAFQSSLDERSFRVENVLNGKFGANDAFNTYIIL